MGEAWGLQIEAFERPVDGLHEQALPPLPWRSVELPAQIVALPVATAVGRVFTPTVTCDVLVDEQPFASVTVREYTCVDAGDAMGVQESAFESPVVGLHEQEAAPFPWSAMLPPVQMVPPPVAEAIGRFATVTVFEPVATQPFFVTVRPRITGDVPPVEYVTVCELAPAVMVPLLMVQA